jgi:pimeloyl-ACP methyl ester carboxylesterase
MQPISVSTAMRRLTARIVVVVGVLMLAGMSLPIARAQTPVSGLAWRPCGQIRATETTPVADNAGTPDGLECATLSVPLDYADPAGAKITLGIGRLPARDQAHRIGNLFINPGGPGASAVDLLTAAAFGVPLFSPDIRDRFDMIGVDPRGVGLSTPVQCDPDIYNQSVSLFPKNEAEYEALLAHNTALGESCLKMTGPVLAHIDTVSAAHDIEAVRQALGSEQLTYLGLSYGSMLGAQYAALYPGSIRAMALDGSLDHDVPEIAMLADEVGTYEASFDRFIAWCADDTTCLLHGQDVGKLFDDLVARANETPLPAPACANGSASKPCRPKVSGEDLRFNVQDFLILRPARPDIHSGGWNDLAQALRQAAAGDASLLSSAVATSSADTLYPGLAIACLDFPAGSKSDDDVAAREELGNVLAPHMQGASQTWTIITGCLGWPVPLVNPPHPAGVLGAPPILIVNSTHDPSTSYRWAVGLFTQIDSGVLVTRVGDGHTSYLLPSPSHTKDAIDHYLLTTETPPPNTVFQD